MKILFYGRLADALGPEIDLDVPPSWSITQVRKQLAKEHPRSADALLGGRALACVSGSVVRDDYLVDKAEQIEFLPPVSGG